MTAHCTGKQQKGRIEKGIGGLAGVAYCRREPNNGARGCFTPWNRLVTIDPTGVDPRMDAPSLYERYITILVIPVIGLAIVLLPFIAFALYTWWSQRRRR